MTKLIILAMTIMLATPAMADELAADHAACRMKAYEVLGKGGDPMNAAALDYIGQCMQAKGHHIRVNVEMCNPAPNWPVEALIQCWEK